MLSIKTGVAIHVDYTFDVKSGDGTLLGSYGFVNNELLPSGLDAFGHEIVFAEGAFGVSNDQGDNIQGVLMPVNTFRLDSQTYENTITHEKDARTVTFRSKATAVVKGFNVPTDKLLIIREFGIKGFVTVKDIENQRAFPLNAQTFALFFFEFQPFAVGFGANQQHVIGLLDTLHHPTRPALFRRGVVLINVAINTIGTQSVG